MCVRACVHVRACACTCAHAGAGGAGTRARSEQRRSAPRHLPWVQEVRENAPCAARGPASRHAPRFPHRRAARGSQQDPDSSLTQFPADRSHSCTLRAGTQSGPDSPMCPASAPLPVLGDLCVPCVPTSGSLGHLPSFPRTAPPFRRPVPARRLCGSVCATGPRPSAVCVGLSGGPMQGPARDYVMPRRMALTVTHEGRHSYGMKRVPGEGAPPPRHRSPSLCGDRGAPRRARHR